VLNTMSPKYFDTSGLANVADKPPITWIHATADQVVQVGLDGPLAIRRRQPPLALPPHGHPVDQPVRVFLLGHFGGWVRGWQPAKP